MGVDTGCWDRVPGYLNAATMGLPPREAVAALRGALAGWAEGKASPEAYDLHIVAARELYARLVGVPVSWVAVGSQVSVFAGTVAASLPAGSSVVCVEGDFTSVIYPFLVQAGQAERGVSVRTVPLQRLADEIDSGTDLVAFSLAQSATGLLADVPAVAAAAAEHGALTLCDTTQATGWMPVDAAGFDLTVCAGYKWLCQPRGTAYLTIRPEVADRLIPNNAGWYAGESVWTSVYGSDMALASDARRFDVSPAWLCWVGAAAAGGVFDRLAAADIRDHGVGLADDLRDRLGQAACARPVVTLEDPNGRLAASLSAAGAVVASRAGGVRIGFHLWNTTDDVDLVHGVLRATG